MSVTFSRHRIRYKLDQSQPSRIINEYTGDIALVYRARAWQFDIGVFYDGALCSVSNLASVTVELKAQTAEVVDTDSAPLATKTVSVLDDTVTDATWESKAAQHASVTFDMSETGLSMTSAVRNVLRLGIIITALTNDASPQRLTLGEGWIDLKDDGGQTSADTPAPGDPTFLNSDEIKALIASYVPIMGTPGGYIRLVNDQGASIILQATPGTATPSLEVSQTT